MNHIPTLDPQLQLRDIHLPAEPSMWPLAIGWWLVIILVIIFIYWLFVIMRQNKKFKNYHTEVQQQFQRLEASLIENPSNLTVAKINTFLRQIAINTYPREDIASLTGSDWLAFLDKSGETSDFTQGVGNILMAAPYQNKSALDAVNSKEFLNLVNKWIKKQIVYKKKSVKQSSAKLPKKLSKKVSTYQKEVSQ